MTLSSKHYELIAEAIKSAQPAEHFLSAGRAGYQAGFEAGASSACEVVAKQLAEKFQSLNPQFNRAKFLAACGVQE
jgi:hypothetical protein